MASSINPNNIDGSYPVAGQDNNSQGFRDNFTNIKVNFQYAEDEINDLDSKVLLKAALTGTTLDNNMNNNTIYAVNLNDVSTTRVALANTSGSVSVNYVSGQYQTIAPSAGSINVSVTNWPAAGYYGSVRLAITVSNIAYTVTFNAGTTLLGTTGLEGYTSISAASGYITFAATGVYVFDLATSDGGATVTITDLSRPLTAFTGSAITGASLSVTGNITGGNVTTAGTINAGVISASGNIIAGSDLYVGPGATTAGFTTSPIMIGKDTGNAYVQLAIQNGTSTGSADYTAYANNGTEAQGWADMGMTGNAFSDAAYTVTGANDGYFFVQGNASTGGNLVIATGNVGTTKDIIFSTGGFLTANIKARLYNASGLFSAVGNIQGGNIITAGLISATSTITSGAITSTGAIKSNSASGGVGYTTGAGGTISQLTSKATTVVLSRPTGQITTFNDSLASATTVSFTLTNTTLAAGDLLVINHISGGTIGGYSFNASCGAGSATIYIRNLTNGALAEALVLGFAVIKAVTA
jgi:hypothetical protein